LEKTAGFVLIKGTGLAVEGPCELVGLIFWPDANEDYADIYDGLDAVGGKKFCRLESSTQITWGLFLATPVTMEHGVYVAGIDSAVETTVLFRYAE
jgi:hypothetical protein